jgi:putative ABC transport system substrate-binding protein
MRRREFAILVAGAAVVSPLRGHSQPAESLKRIGLLRVGPLPKEWSESFRQRLRDHGLVEGQNCSIELGLAEHAAQIPEVLDRLVQRKVDVIVASGVPSVLPAKERAGTIPVVFVFSGDPVAMGLAASLVRPGGTLTGITFVDSAITAKRFQLLKELVPGLSNAALVLRTNGPENARYIEEAQRAQRDLGLQVQFLTVRNADDLARTLGTAEDTRALAVVADAQFTAERARIAELALQHRLPTMFTHRPMVEAGGLMSYGPDYEAVYRSAADQVHKILRGDNPADIPVEQPAKFEHVINLRTAKALGLTVPPTLLMSATEVID